MDFVAAATIDSTVAAATDCLFAATTGLKRPAYNSYGRCAARTIYKKYAALGVSPALTKRMTDH